MVRHLFIALAACGFALLSSCKDNSLFMSKEAENRVFEEYRVSFWEMIRLKELASSPDATAAIAVEYNSAIEAEKQLRFRIAAIDETRSKEWISFLQNSQSAHEAAARSQQIKDLRALVKESEDRGKSHGVTSFDYPAEP
jgi:hypothetical protein